MTNFQSHTLKVWTRRITNILFVPTEVRQQAYQAATARRSNSEQE